VDRIVMEWNPLVSAVAGAMLILAGIARRKEGPAWLITMGVGGGAAALLVGSLRLLGWLG